MEKNGKIDQTNYFETKFLTEKEPWNYSSRAVELLRYEFIINLLNSLSSDHSKILEVGCALGQFTEELYGIGKDIYSFDISISAVKKTRDRCSSIEDARKIESQKKSQYHFCLTSATDLPFQHNVFDIVLLCDGLIGWEITKEQRAAVLEQAYNCITDEGYVILTDYLHPKKFEMHLNEIRASSLKIKNIIYMNDRLAYRFETWFKAFRNAGVIKKLIANKKFVRFLMRISSISGKSGSKHLCVVAVKK